MKKTIGGLTGNVTPQQKEITLNSKSIAELAQIKMFLESRGVEVDNEERIVRAAISDFYMTLGLNKKRQSAATDCPAVTQ